MLAPQIDPQVGTNSLHTFFYSLIVPSGNNNNAKVAVKF